MKLEDRLKIVKCYMHRICNATWKYLLEEGFFPIETGNWVHVFVLKILDCQDKFLSIHERFKDFFLQGIFYQNSTQYVTYLFRWLMENGLIQDSAFLGYREKAGE